jgi:hypothetical protein
MRNSKQFRLIWIILVVAVLVSLPVGSAMAGYLDPGSGSLIIQIVIATILGLLVAIRIYWNRIVAFFTGRKPETDNPEENGPAPESRDEGA